MANIAYNEQLEVSGDMAYRLFTSSEPFPLHSFLCMWKDGAIEADAAYVLAVIGAYRHMERCHDGKRDGTYRPR